MIYISIITARGGSKRLPRKNILNLAGKPLIAYSIECSRICPFVDDTYVSTDDDEIRRVSEEYGAKVIDRPGDLAGDFVSSAAVMQHAASVLIEQGVHFDYALLLQPTQPLRPLGLLEEAIGIIEHKRCDSLMSVTPSYQKLGKIIDEKFVPWNYYLGQRSQDMEPLYYENGLLYISSKELLLSGKIIGDEMFPMVVDHEYSKVDIDTKADFEYAEMVVRLNK